MIDHSCIIFLHFVTHQGTYLCLLSVYNTEHFINSTTQVMYQLPLRSKRNEADVHSLNPIVVEEHVANSKHIYQEVMVFIAHPSGHAAIVQPQDAAAVLGVFAGSRFRCYR